MLRGLDLRIDQDDRIALLGQNGQGKSTLAKLLSDRLAPMAGPQGRLLEAPRRLFRPAPGRRARRSTRRRCSTSRACGPTRRPASCAAGSPPAASAPTSSTTEVGRLSGGQKARLALLLATLDAPHLIILDEPTNHLDIESREALVEALTEYGGAVILVSHDPHLVELVADRLWLVKDGRVTPFDDDMDAYRRLLLSERGGAPVRARDEKPQSRAPAAAVRGRRRCAPRSRRCEARVAKLEEMRDAIDARLANPLLYARGDTEEIETLQTQARRGRGRRSPAPRRSG